ncbi:c-type cytochrome domain-containing protein [Rubinisphaera margarita]|uniref:c-type cytochrome domain-containing protein n=1 Tax=Rubinisphaera margarita TaxID=2909586 RepID=UPI001EE8E2A0|nr:c-type cytochrome domain-containing protein [Rubinisphaera margarita]MCG6156053.1 hypothetical protein [Rubinisphaera margarita]
MSGFTRKPYYRLVLLGLACLAASPVMADDDEDLAKEAFAVFKAKCYVCHGGEETYSGLRILDGEVLFANRTGKPFVARGDLSSSKIWEVVQDDNMPVSPDDYVTPVPLSEAEKATIKKWIEGGAPLPQSGSQREFISRIQVLEWIDDDTRRLDRRDKPNRKYLSLVNLHNNPNVTDYNLRLYRAALSKALNSLSLSDQIEVPEAIDEYGTVFRIDLDDYGWTIEKWSTMLDNYPYGFSPDSRQDDELELFRLLEQNLGANFDRFPTIRADWFIARATRPEIYHMFLDIPDTVTELERRLGVDREDDLEDGDFVRGGVLVSGISSQNRILDRHSSNFGSYWISYDFSVEAGRGNISRFPLGPEHNDETLNRFAFKHDGGEIVFRLPNGLQGYMLTDGEGNRIDKGPTNIVADNSRVSGTTEIINGLSCITCHKHGMKPFDDVVSFTHGVRDPEVVEMIETVYDVDEIQKHLRRDQAEHLVLLKRTIGPFLQIEEDKDTPIEKFPEPISLVAREYDQNMTATEMACELGLKSTDELRLNDPDMIDLGLGLLRDEFKDRPADLVYKRAMFDTLVDGQSVFHEVIRELGIGVPIRRSGGLTSE